MDSATSFDQMITQDVDPGNELTLEPGRPKSSSRSQGAFLFSLENQMRPNFRLFVGYALGDFSRHRVQGSTGLDNPASASGRVRNRHLL